jgi:hypothetical protein
MTTCRSIFVAVLAIVPLLTSSAETAQGTKVGTLACQLSPSIGLIIGSQQRMACRFTPSGSSQIEKYAGVMNRIGLDIGITAGGGLVWGVYASTGNTLARGSLAGRYGGASGDIGVGLGVGANVLFGGSNNTVSLQPISLEGSFSLNLALGVAGLTLTWVP